jgi:hypothetical protein
MYINLKSTGTRYQIKPLTLILFLITLQLIITLLSNGFVLSFDESIWHYIGRNWFRHGLVPYTGGTDNKSPFIFAIFGLSDTLFGVNYWFPRVLATLCQSIGIYYLYKIAQKLAGDTAGLLVILFYGLSLLWHATGSQYVAFTETYEVMFMTGAVYRYVNATNKQALLISGLLAGLALDFRLSAAFVILAILIHALFRKRFVDILVFCIGVISGLLFLIIVCVLAGIDLQQLLINGLLDNFGKGSATDHTAAFKFDSFCHRFIYSPLVLFYPLMLLYVFVKRKIDLPVLWFILAFVGINMIGIYDVVHLKDLLPPLSLLNAIAAAYFIDKYKLPMGLVVLGIGIVFFPSMTTPIANLKTLLGSAEPPIIYSKAPYVNPPEADRKTLGKWIKAHTSSTDMVLVHSFGTQVQVYSERLSPTIYFSITQTPIAKARFYHDLQQNKPAMILIPMFPEYQNMVDADLRTFVSDLVKGNYHLDSIMYNYQIFRINK